MVIIMDQTEKQITDRKILIIGLENSGKTSILLTLKEDTNLLSYTSLKPTRGINIATIDKQDSQLIIWDMGGQEQYRTDHLKKLNRYLSGTESIIFIIDIQDLKKYDIAFEYLEKVVNEIKKENVSVKLSIFLHKYDPNITHKKEFKNIDEVINSQLIPKIDRIMPQNFDYRIFKTSIYTVFEKMLIK